jgi:hypothetical protein
MDKDDLRVLLVYIAMLLTMAGLAGVLLWLIVK